MTDKIERVAKVTENAMQSPYLNLPSRAFWRQGVAERPKFDPGDIFKPRFSVSRDDRIMTAGSCFAQHVGRTLKQADFNVLDLEPAPVGVPPAFAAKFAYGLYTARYGNIYTTRQLVQLFEEAHGICTPANPIWEKNGRYYDAQRPNAEPLGLATEAEVLRLREHHLANVKEAFASTDLFVFTFGLTEAWIDRASKTVYPTAPGTIAGTYDPDVYAFHNFTHSEILADFLRFRDYMRDLNKDIRFLITTSPVPLTATASDAHVEVATVYSKSVLRSVCGELYNTYDDIEYFPSFEIITSQRAGGEFYEKNLRSVSDFGVNTAMSVFMRAQGLDVELPTPPLPDHVEKPSGSALDQLSLEEAKWLVRRKKRHLRRQDRQARLAEQAAQTTDASNDLSDDESEQDVICEEALLEGFAKQ